MRVPIATYRFQFHKGFNFQQARALIPYLRELGISDVYASPIFLAGPNSTHGYDICGFDKINPNLGTNEDFSALTTDLRNAGMGLLVDMVPNHMGSHSANCWWIDVLRNGRNSKFATYFDINWDSSNAILHGKVLLPVLGDHYGTVLERGELQVVFDNGEFHLAYFDKLFPVSPESVRAFKLEELSVDDPNTRHQRKQSLTNLNGRPGEPQSFDRLHEFIDLQHYRLAYWRVGPHEINYRRFFDVTELVSVRVEDETVFNATHKFLLDLVRSDKITGLRIDHPDGLRDPKTYFERLQQSGREQFVLAEKILSDDEQLPADWPIHGTTGYDYLNFLNGIFVQRDHERDFTAIYSRFTGSSEDFASLAFRSKQDVLNRMFIAEVNSLTVRLKSISAARRDARDFTETELRAAIIDFIAGFPVYRTYVTAETRQLSESELAYIRHGGDEAKKRTKAIDTRALDFLARVLSLEMPENSTKESSSAVREFVIRFQQLSGPATAKGLEDTAFYRYTRFVSLNEVGGNPGRFGISPDEFHTHNTQKHRQWPNSMLATSTHDTKRGEDTRARLSVLSEMPAEWEQAVNEWCRLNTIHKQKETPAPVDEYLLYQSLVGTWSDDPNLPTYIERIQNYMLKATREAKTYTTWTEPDDAYESATKHFIAAILNSVDFRASLSEFADEIAYFGMFNSVAQVILKTCSPGIPDFYQGTEHWDLTLVDPDNRRPIDYPLRQQLLPKIRFASPSELLGDWKSGAIKTFTTANTLRARREQTPIREGDYRPINVTGARSNHVVAFARTHRSSTVIVAVPRFIRTLTQAEKIHPTPDHWQETRLDFTGGRFRNLLTGEQIQSLSAAEIFQTFPGAILLPLD